MNFILYYRQHEKFALPCRSQRQLAGERVRNMGIRLSPTAHAESIEQLLNRIHAVEMGEDKRRDAKYAEWRRVFI